LNSELNSKHQQSIIQKDSLWREYELSVV